MIEQEKINKIEIRSEEFQEILGVPPHWLLRTGILVVFLFVIVILTGSYFFKYPDIIEAQVSIVTKNPPVPLKSYSSGKLTHLFVNEGDGVKKNDVIAVIENTAHLPDMDYLKFVMDTLCDFFYFPDTLNLNLGEIHSSYSGLLRIVKTYRNFKELGYYDKKAESTKRQIEDSRKYYYELMEQQKIMKQEIAIAGKLFERDKNLFLQDVLAKAEFEKSEQAFLQQQRAFESFNASLTATQMQVTQLELQILDLQLQKNQELNNFDVQLNEAFESLKNQLLKWEQTYLIRSPITGYVTFNQIWAKNQNVQSGETVATVIPDNETEIIGKVIIPAAGVGKVRTGQNVNIKLDNFPYMEFGLIKANVKNISLVPMETEKDIFYTAEVDLPFDFISNYGKKLQFSQNMSGVAEIITDDVRLLERFLSPVKFIWKKNIEN